MANQGLEPGSAGRGPRAHRQRGGEGRRMRERADRLQNRASTPDRKDGRRAASTPNPASDDNAMPARTGAERRSPAAIFVEKARHLSKYGHDVLIYTQ
jgi:hypothetical protein